VHCRRSKKNAACCSSASRARYSFGRPLHTLPSQFQTEIDFETVDHTKDAPPGIKFGAPKKPAFDEDSQEVPDDFLDFDFGEGSTNNASRRPVPQGRSAEFEERDDDVDESTDEVGGFNEPTIEPSIESFDERLARSSSRSALSDLKSKLTTGAALLQSRTSESTPVFAIGNSVRHPRYGIGKVVEVGQIMRRQSVTVEFPQDARRETFVAEKCPLTLVGLR
jgi:hypothetical protein